MTNIPHVYSTFFLLKVIATRNHNEMPKKQQERRNEGPRTKESKNEERRNEDPRTKN